MRVVLDTNVIAAGILGVVKQSTLPPAQIMRRWEEGHFVLVVSDHILAELERALNQRWFTDRVPQPTQSRFMGAFRRRAEVVTATTVVSGSTGHWEDDLVLAAAVSGDANFLVTGDAEFLRVGNYQAVTICTASEFLRVLERDSQ